MEKDISAPFLNFQPMLEAMIFSLIGIMVFALAVFILDKITPFSIWKEIAENKNSAVAIFVGSVIIGISLIVALAHG